MLQLYIVLSTKPTYKEDEMKEIMLPKKAKKSFFTREGIIAFFIVIFLLILLAAGWYAYALYQESAALQKDGGYHTVEGWKAISPE